LRIILEHVMKTKVDTIAEIFAEMDTSEIAYLAERLVYTQNGRAETLERFLGFTQQDKWITEQKEHQISQESEHNLYVPSKEI